MLKLYAVVWIFLFVLFGFVQEAGYVTDYLGWQARVEEGGFLGALHTYDYPAQLQGYALLMWLIEQLRSISTWLVHVFNVSLLAGGAVLLYQLVRKVLEDLGHDRSKLAGTLALLLFILSPTNTEIMIWRVCPHYLVSIIVWLGTLLLLRTYMQRGSSKHLYWTLLLQVVGLFCLELAYALPIAVLGWVGFYSFFLRSGNWKRAMIAFTSAISLVAMHLLLTKIVQGAWIGHYGAEVATSQPLSEIVAAPWRWMARAGLHYRFWATPLKKWLSAGLGNPIVSLGLYAVVALSTARAILLWLRSSQTKSKPPVWTAILLWIFLAGAGTAAVSQMYYFDLFLVDTDRLGALTVVFTVALIGTLLSLLKSNFLKFAFVPVVLISGFIQFKTISTWYSSQVILSSLTSSFSEILTAAETRGEHPTTVYLLGYARTFNGVHLIGDNRDGYSALAGYLASSVSRESKLRDDIKLVDITQFHQKDISDEVKARWKDEVLYVSLNAPGSWLMHNDLGVKNRRDDKNRLSVTVNEWNIQVDWDTPPSQNTLFLYQQNSRFVRLPYPAAKSLRSRKGE